MTWPPEKPLTFDPGFRKLGKPISRFANHTRRYLMASLRHRTILTKVNDWSNGQAPLDTTPINPTKALAAVDRFARLHREKRTTLVGAYFAHHYLRSQAELSRDLLRESYRMTPGHRVRTCWRIYQSAEKTRREWVASLLELSIREACPDLDPNDYVALNTGALIDHEDVDLAFVVTNVEARTALSRGFSLVSRTFVRYASKIQLFLTEELDTPRVCALVDEYAELKERPTRSIVSIMQLLGAQYLCGSQTLHKRLQDEVISAYYAGQGEPIIHEGFLRSIMAELKHYLVPTTTPGVLAPKREVYIPTKLVTAAMRVVHGVVEPLHPLALKAVAERDPERRDIYVTLANSAVQVEVMRALIFLYVYAGDEIQLQDPASLKASEHVALLLGLRESPRRTTANRLLGYYAELRSRALTAFATLSEEISRHLNRVSTFRKIVERGKNMDGSSSENMAENLMAALEAHQGGVFWDEVVELISRQYETGHRFVQDFANLSSERRVTLATRYVEMMCEDAPSFVDFLVFLADKDRDLAQTRRNPNALPSDDILVSCNQIPVPQGSATTSALNTASSAYETTSEFSPLSLPSEQNEPESYDITTTGTNARLFWSRLIAHLEAHPRALEQFTQRLDTETKSEALFRLANAFPSKYLAHLADLIEAADPTPRGARVTRALRSMLVLVHHRSNAIGRIASRVLARTTEFVQRIGDGRRLKELATEIMQRAAQEPRPAEQVRLLADAGDVATLRAAIQGVLKGAPASQDKEHVAAVDQFVRELFKAYFREVRQRSPMFQHYRPGSRVAIFATGGYGRGEAFGSDFDYIALVSENDPGLQKFFGKILQRVSATMARCGLQPHNRFADIFCSYTVSLPELLRYLKERHPDVFIDEAEVLEGRFFLGDPLLARRFDAEVRTVVTQDNRKAFIYDILGEIRERQQVPPHGLNAKLGPGGLRDIHLLWLALRAFAKLDHPFGAADLRAMVAQLDGCGGELRFLMVAHDELRRARDLYRLMVAFDDYMEPQLMIDIANNLKPLSVVGIRGDYGHQLKKLMEATRLRVDRVAQRVMEKIEEPSSSQTA
ncbi:MAG: hypothetical protein KTR25_15025 [Myxococcales bacterium]|nr:hypothetical protein [Myxococcales bacterium]